MIIKLIFLILLIYYGIRAVGNLLQAVRSDPSRVPTPPMAGRPPSEDAHRSPEYREKVEDARWIDL